MFYFKGQNVQTFNNLATCFVSGSHFCCFFHHIHESLTFIFEYGLYIYIKVDCKKILYGNFACVHMQTIESNV